MKFVPMKPQPPVTKMFCMVSPNFLMKLLRKRRLFNIRLLVTGNWQLAAANSPLAKYRRLPISGDCSNRIVRHLERSDFQQPEASSKKPAAKPLTTETRNLTPILSEIWSYLVS
jgi:hypothetical protein